MSTGEKLKKFHYLDIHEKDRNHILEETGLENSWDGSVVIMA
jgi:hypothetical protein